MKHQLKVNSIGLGDSKKIILSELLIFSGVALSGLGLFILRRSQCWKVATKPTHFEYINAIVNALEDSFRIHKK